MLLTGHPWSNGHQHWSVKRWIRIYPLLSVNEAINLMSEGMNWLISELHWFVMKKSADHQFIYFNIRKNLLTQLKIRGGSIFSALFLKIWSVALFTYEDDYSVVSVFIDIVSFVLANCLTRISIKRLLTDGMKMLNWFISVSMCRATNSCSSSLKVNLIKGRIH